MSRTTELQVGFRFSSASLTEHVLRGLGGAAAIYGAVAVAQSDDAWWATAASLALGGAALVFFRGCPVCWTIGLMLTVKEAVLDRRRSPNRLHGPSGSQN